MKRSEAVERFARHINNKIQHRDNWNLALSQADELLKIAEEFMLPPTAELCAGGEIMSVKELCDYSEIYYQIKWEEEDAS